jgi:hypothetical protein
MILKYNYSHIISKEDQKRAIKLTDNLIRKGDWHKTSPKFQTLPNLHTYEEFKIFTNTFIDSCFNYLNIIFDYKIKMWVYRDNRFNSKKKNPSQQWHEHSSGKLNRLSGIYYLQNLRNEGTEFKNFNVIPELYTWYIFPSHLLHKPPVIKSFRNRYTIAADFEYS